MTQQQKPSLTDTIKEWGSIILSGLGIVFLLTLLRKDNGSEIQGLKSDIKDVEDNIKDIELSDPSIDEIINRWNNRNK
jgi:hypothetical protein